MSARLKPWAQVYLTWFFMLLALVLLLSVIAGKHLGHKPVTPPKDQWVFVDYDTHEPYGGCDEAYLYPDSPGAADCRKLGWYAGTPASWYQPLYQSLLIAV